MKNEIQTIIQTFSKSSVGYIKISVGGETLEVSKSAVSASSKPLEVEDSISILPKIYEIFSTNVGRYFFNADQIFKEGDLVSPKTVLGYVESMGLRHDVLAGYTGFIDKIDIQDGDIVEYGQILFVIKEQGA